MKRRGADTGAEHGDDAGVDAWVALYDMGGGVASYSWKEERSGDEFEAKCERLLSKVEANAAASAEFLSHAGDNRVGWLGWVPSWQLA